MPDLNGPAFLFNYVLPAVGLLGFASRRQRLLSRLLFLSLGLAQVIRCVLVLRTPGL